MCKSSRDGRKEGGRERLNVWRFRLSLSLSPGSFFESRFLRSAAQPSLLHSKSPKETPRSRTLPLRRFSKRALRSWGCPMNPGRRCRFKGFALPWSTARRASIPRPKGLPPTSFCALHGAAAPRAGETNPNTPPRPRTRHCAGSDWRPAGGNSQTSSLPSPAQFNLARRACRAHSSRPRRSAELLQRRVPRPAGSALGSRSPRSRQPARDDWAARGLRPRHRTALCSPRNSEEQQHPRLPPHERLWAAEP